MPEGPSILYLKDQLLPFIGKVVKKAGGYGPMPTPWINGKKLLSIQTWGKHLLLCFANGTVRLHLGLFGEILINERKNVNRSFFLEFASGEINGYVVKAQKIDKNLEPLYDWRTDIMSPRFDAKHIKSLLRKNSNKRIHELLMKQDIFTGVGNKIRNEALYRASIHPMSTTGKIPAGKISKLIKEVKIYANIFYQELKKDKHNKKFSVYMQEYAADGSEVTIHVLRKEKRKLYFSRHRQKLYN